MKQCPKCGNSYTDDTLRFCLEDGTPLIFADEQPTVMRSGGRDANKTEELPNFVTGQAGDGIRVTVPTAEPATQAQQILAPAKSRSILLTVLIAVVALGGLVVIATAGIAGFLYYSNTGRSQIAISNSSTPTPSWNTPESTPSNDETNLDEQIEKLKKQIEGISNSNSDTDVTIEEDNFAGFGRTANVNSPNDGFLALRNLPSTDIGQRIAKIPHAAEVKVIMCSNQKATIAGRTGHWCMVTYNEHTGWVFDVWLSFATDSKN